MLWVYFSSYSLSLRTQGKNKINVIFCQKKIKKFRIFVYTANREDDGEESYDEGELLDEQDTELLDESKSNYGKI